MASDNEHNEIGLNVANVPLDLEKEDGELSTYSFDSVTSTPLSLALSQITINGAESPFTDVSSLHQMILEEEEKETNTLNELEQEKNRLLKQIESELEKKKKKTKKNKGQLLKEIAYLKQVKNKIKHSEKKGKIKKKKSKKKTKSKIRKRRNSVVGIAQQEHIAQQDDGIPNTLNDENCEDDRLFPSLHEVRTIIPTEINNDLKVTIIGSAKPEKVSRIDEKEPIGTSHYPHSKSKRKKSSDSRNKSPKFYDEIECCSNERSESGSDECLEIEKSPMKSHHARHRIGHPTDTRLKRKTKSKSPNRRRHSRDEDRSDKKHTKSKSPNQRRHSRDENGSNKKYHYEEHLRRKSSHSDPDSGYPGKRHPRHRSSSSSSSLSSSSGSSANSEHSVKFIDFLVKSVIRNKEVVELSSRTSSSRGNSPASDNTLPLHLNTTSTFFNPNYHHSSTITPASPEIHIIGKVVPTNTSIAIDINRNEQSIEKEPSEPIIIPPSFPEESVPEGERNFSSLLLNFPFTSKDIPNHYDNDVPINSNINLPVPAPLSHHSEDNLSNYNVMSMETESLYDPFETSTELSDDVANITVVEGIRGRKEMMEANMVRYQSGVDNTTRNKANLITITSVENNAIETPLGQSGCNSNSQTVIEQIKTGQKEPENNTDLNNDQLKKRQSIDSENTLNEQEKSDTENSQLVIVKKISRSETALDNTRSVKENHGNETDSENAQLGRGKHTSETDKSSQKMHQTIANKTSFKDAQSTEKYLETIETTQTMKDFLDNATVGANTQFGKDKPDVETIMNQESDTVSRSVTYDNHRELDIDLGLEDELGLLPNMEHRDICIYQLDMDCLLQNPEIPDFVANGVAEFFAELQRVLCIAAFSKNVKNDDILCIEKWFVIINSVYLDLIYLKNQYTFVKMVKYEHVLNVILDHFQDCVDNAIKMYAEVLPQYIKHIEVIRGWLNSHIDKKKMLTSSADQYGAKFFEKNKRNIKNFLFERVQKLQRRLEFSNVGNNCRPVPQPIEPPCLDVFEVTNNIEGNNCCPVPQPSKPYQDVFEVTNKIEHMLILKDGPKCYEMFEKISLDTLEHLLNKIKQELQDSEAEVYVTKCKELINEKIRITTLKEYIEKMYKSYVVQNNIVLNHITFIHLFDIFFQSGYSNFFIDEFFTFSDVHFSFRIL
uniref:Uncharacterized protein n=1 Tax=Cacopsylla melanoneura TaxID=428564 RepID=A0A8D8V927_9HEMI